MHCKNIPNDYFGKISLENRNDYFTFAWASTKNTFRFVLNMRANKSINNCMEKLKKKCKTYNYMGLKVIYVV